MARMSSSYNRRAFSSSDNTAPRPERATDRTEVISAWLYAGNGVGPYSRKPSSVRVIFGSSPRDARGIRSGDDRMIRPVKLWPFTPPSRMASSTASAVAVLL